MQYLIILVLTILCFGLYLFSVRFFLLSILVIYPIVGQMVSLDFRIMGQTINVSMAYGGLIFAICFIETLKQVIINCNEEINTLTIICILFLLSCLFSILLSINKFNSLMSTIKVATWILLMLVARRNFKGANDLLWISRLAIFSSLIIIFSYIFENSILIGY